MDFYNWGEPLLNPHLEDFIRVAKAHNVASCVSTNLSLPISDARIERLLISGVSDIGVALDGASEETYTQYRRKGNFDLVLENMRRLVQARRRLGQDHPMISWIYIVFGYNEHEIGKAKQMAAEIGVDRLVLRPPFLDGSRYNLSEADSRAIVHWAPSNPKFRIPHSAATQAKAVRLALHRGRDQSGGKRHALLDAFKKSDDFGTVGKFGEHRYFDVMNNPAFRVPRGARFHGGTLGETERRDLRALPYADHQAIPQARLPPGGRHYGGAIVRSGPGPLAAEVRARRRLEAAHHRCTSQSRSFPRRNLSSL